MQRVSQEFRHGRQVNAPWRRSRSCENGRRASDTQSLCAAVTLKSKVPLSTLSLQETTSKSLDRLGRVLGVRLSTGLYFVNSLRQYRLEQFMKTCALFVALLLAVPVFSQTKIDFLQEGRDYTNLFYAGKANDIWANLSPAMKKVFSEADAILGMQLQTKGQLGAETEVVEEHVLLQEDFVVYQRIVMFQKITTPEIVQWTFDHEGVSYRILHTIGGRWGDPFPGLSRQGGAPLAVQGQLAGSEWRTQRGRKSSREIQWTSALPPTSRPSGTAGPFQAMVLNLSSTFVSEGPSLLRATARWLG